MIPYYAQLLRNAAKLAGESTYESELLCPRCRLCLRYVKTNSCVTCVRARGKSRRIKPAMDFPHLARDRENALARGDLLWWPGKRCQCWHLAPRYAVSNWCQTCIDWGIVVPSNWLGV